MAMRTEHAPEPSVQKHSVHFWDSITFKVEGVVFQLPKYRFVEESEVFMEMVAKDAGDGPIDLDVSLVDFESFLKAFLPRASAMYDDKPTLVKEEWISILKLSTKWLFNDLRQLAISNLSFPSLGLITDPIERICLAKEYNVYCWLLDGYREVIQRLLTADDAGGSPMTLTVQEGRRIGMDVALELSGIAIRRMRLAEREAPLKDVESDVLDTFKLELDCVRKEGARFITKSQRSEEAARKKVEEEVREMAKEAKRKAEAKQKKKLKKMEEKAAQRVLEEEAEKERAFREAERKKEAEMELKRQGEKPKNVAQAEKVEKSKPTEWFGHIGLRRSVRGIMGTSLQEEARKRVVEEEETRRMVAEKASRLEEGEGKGSEVVNPGGLEEEDLEELKKRIAKRLQEEEELEWQERQRKWEEEDRKRKDAEDKNLRALVEEELRRRKVLAGGKEENTSG
ncbi:hypothetical protein BKA70DRAFT_1414320 [Coprinopsis sp. MPI-PUGE-AT-0042]|nr:hypothetical protein BKA70DRAFT_1414320 [Coprinopsis sp. MPI-PUGE-AT-0042]